MSLQSFPSLTEMAMFRRWCVHQLLNEPGVLIALFPWGLLRWDNAVWNITGCPAGQEYRRVYLGSGWNTLSRSLVSTKQTSCLSKSMCVSWMCKRSPYAAVYVLKRGENCPALCLETVLERKRAALKSVFRSWYINIYIYIVYSIHAYKYTDIVRVICWAYYCVFDHVLSTC